MQRILRVVSRPCAALTEPEHIGRAVCGGNSLPASCVWRATKEIHMLGLLIGVAALGGGFVATRKFLRRRLRFVDGVHKPAAPPAPGLAAGLAPTPVGPPPGRLLPVPVGQRPRF